MVDETKEIDRIYIIPLQDVKHGRSSLAAPRAVKTVKRFLTRHMKVAEDKIWIDSSVNDALWTHGKYYIPSKIRVRAVKFEDGVVEVSLPEIELKKSRRELLKEEKEKKEKEPILRKEEVEEKAEEQPSEKSEEVEVVPTADGGVKIKKKKAPKIKEEKEDKKEEEGVDKDKKEIEQVSASSSDKET
ncbi:MAG: 50S ribosomal protein L31e [Candidatus Thermoplasmatota archaeon]